MVLPIATPRDDESDYWKWAQEFLPSEDDVSLVLAQWKQGTETVSAEHHRADVGAYNYTVSIQGGIYSGLEIHCRTERSVIWLFDQIVEHRKADRDWVWLWPTITFGGLPS